MVVAQDGASQVLRGISSSFGGLGTAIQSLTGGRVLEELTGQIIKFGKEGVDATLKYANEVRSLQLVSGESAESSSRFLQVLDDYKMSAQDAMLATKALTKNGLAPNIDTLAKLSDEYIALNSVEARNEFILKNLGKGGLQWAEVLSKGSKTLREQGDAIADNLILSQQAVDDAREYEVAMDSLNDAVMGFKISLGQHLIPALTDTMNAMRDDSRAMEILREQGINTFFATMKQQQAAKEQAIAEREAADAAMVAAEALKVNGEAAVDNASAIKAAEEAVKKLSEANTEYLSSIGSLSDADKDFKKQQGDIIKQQFELRQEMNKLIAEGFDPMGEEVMALKDKYGELEQKTMELAQAKEEATHRMILAMLQEQLAVDGLDAKETNFLISQGVKWGVYSETAVAEMQEAQREVASLIGQYSQIPSEINTTITTTYVNEGYPSLMQSAPGYWDSEHRAGGGGVNAGQMYRVNETRQEFFKPSMSGEVVPLGGGGGNGGAIVIEYRPMVSTADRSEIQNVLLPAIIDGIRKAKSDGII